MDFYTVAQIGPTRSMTPEGYLLCRDVPIARTGQQEYLATELGGVVAGDARGIVTIQRDPEEVFRPETIASFNGKPIITHLHQMLDAKTWRGRSVGTVLNPRRSDDGAGDFLIADLLICDATAIQLVGIDGATPIATLQEVSCGYTSDYEETAPGAGRQINIIGNHLAIVERGRCGPACAIGDTSMPAQRKPGLFARLRKAIKTGDNEAIEEVVAEAEEAAEAGAMPNIIINVPGPTGEVEEKKVGDEEVKEPTLADVLSAVNAIGERVTKLESGGAKTGDEEASEEEKKNAEEEAAAKKAADTGDSAALLTVFQEAVSGAEILAPGIGLPTFDAKVAPATTTASICTLRRNAMATFLGTAPGTAWGDSLGVKAAHLDAMTCDAIAGLFPVAVRDRKAGTQAARGGSMTFATGDQAKAYKPKTPAEMNAAHRKQYGFTA